MAQFLSLSSGDDFGLQWQKVKMFSTQTSVLKAWESLCFRKTEIEICHIYVIFQLPGEAIEWKNPGYFSFLFYLNSFNFLRVDTLKA